MVMDHVPDTQVQSGDDPDGTDAQIIERSRSDARAFMPLVRRHQRVIFGYLARRVGQDVAEEITAETFARAFALRERYDTSRADARPWLFGIALNLMRRHLRSEQRQLTAYARTGVDPAERPHDAADERVDAVVQGRRLASALASLKGPDREALLLYAWGELSYDEIADALEIPVGTVRSRLNRARRQVRSVLAAPSTSQGISTSTTAALQPQGDRR